MTYEESACVCFKCGTFDRKGHGTEWGHFLCRKCWGGTRVTGPMGYDQQPLIVNHEGGRGVQVQRNDVPVNDKVPSYGIRVGGRGVQAQSLEVANGTGRLSAPFP